MAELPLIERARSHGDRTAIVASEGTFSYQHLLAYSARVGAELLEAKDDLAEARVPFLIPPSFAWVAIQWGIWRAGGIAVPMATSHPPAELDYVVKDTGAEVVVVHPEWADRIRSARYVTSTELLSMPAPRHSGPPRVGPSRRALIVYTSGTTGKPKGAVTTHSGLEAQVTALIDAWGWTRDDRILLVLPLHHVHGIVNVLTCALWAGAVCEMAPKFDADKVWERIAKGDLTLFMAVPTIYQKLIAAWDSSSPDRRKAYSAGCRKMRLMVSGSAALPVSTLERWHEISGHVLLERYGMTETGMILSNPLKGERRPGSVGNPLPRVVVRLVDEFAKPVPLGEPGEIEVRGPAVFKEYWGKPDATVAAFREGWFRTGDVAVFEHGAHRILGRNSVDIIKTGGYKVSAIEIEEVLRTHPAVAECAVVGIEDPEWGERVCVAVEVKGGAELTLEILEPWAREQLAPYKVPRALKCVVSLPRNAMGKVVKKEVAALFA